MLDDLPRIDARADNGSITLAGNITIDAMHHHNECGYRPCPVCQERLIAVGARRCKHCRRAARDLRRRRIAGAVLTGFAVCVVIGLALADQIGMRDGRWPFAVLAALAIFCAGASSWMWADVPRYLRRIGHRLMHPCRLTRLAGPVSMRLRSAMSAPSRRAPGSDEETHMEPNPVDEARAAKLCAEAAKLMAESARINAQARWFPLVVTGAVFSAATLLVKFLI